MEAGQDDSVEFQPLGFVHGHDLDGRAVVATRILIGLGIERGDLAIQSVEREAAACVKFVDETEVSFGIGALGRIVQAGFAAKHAPDGLDPAPRAQPALLRQRFGEYSAQMLQALLAVGGHVLNAFIIVDELPHRALVIVGSERMQVGQGEAAPGCAQCGEPVNAVAAMMKGACEGQQVLHHLPLGEGFDFHGLIAQFGRAALQLGDQRVEITAGANEDGDAAGWVGSALGAQDGDDLLCFIDAGALGILGDQHRMREYACRIRR